MLKKFVLLTIATFIAIAPNGLSAKENSKSPIKKAEIKRKTFKETRRFDKREWLSNINSRSYQWKKFLEEYNLIGMKQSELEALLGQPIWNKDLPDGDGSLPDYPPMPIAKSDTIGTYQLGSTNWCGNTSRSVQILLDSGKVVSWRFYAMHQPNQWYTKNVASKAGSADFDSAKLPSIPNESNDSKPYDFESHYPGQKQSGQHGRLKEKG